MLIVHLASPGGLGCIRLFDLVPRPRMLTPLCVRDLAALSVHPLLVTPTHYTGEPGYISDTEDTGIINTNTGHGEQTSQGGSRKEEL